MNRHLSAYVMVPACAATIVIGLVTPASAHGITERVSVGPEGQQGEGGEPSISADGRYAIFT